MRLLRPCFDENNAPTDVVKSVELHVLFAANAELISPLTEGEIEACIEQMTAENRLFRSDDTLYEV